MRRLDVNTFYSLTSLERLELVMLRGELIAGIHQCGSDVNLYAVNGAFVEIYFSFSDGCIEAIEIMEYTDERLSSYAEQVVLTELFT